MLSDTLGRKIDYLRLSLTPACPLRCVYCRPTGHHSPVPQCPLTPQEIEELVDHMASLHGLRKVRLTGGDPTQRTDLLDIIGRLARVPGIEDLTMTTHGLTLATHAARYRDAGLGRVNVSLDTLDADQFRRITGADGLGRVVAGIGAAIEAGLRPVRINTVVMRDRNHEQLPALVRFAARRDLEIRFIELMPMGPLAGSWEAHYVPEEEMRAALSPIIREWRPLTRRSESARRYEVDLDDGTSAVVGFISAMSRCFCDDCNRIRLTSDGTLYPCLMDRAGGNLLPALRPQFNADLCTALLRSAVQSKQPEHPAAGAAVMTLIGG